MPADDRARPALVSATPPGDGPAPNPQSPPRISPKKLAANRANARKSTGPRTPEGKARSSRNGLKHGQTASPLTLLATASDEERDLFERLMAQLYDTFHPENPAEVLLVERLGIAYLRLLRVYLVERGAMTNRYKYAGSSGITSLPFDVYQVLEYDAVAERSILRVVRELRRLGVTRRAARSEPTQTRPNPPAPEPAHASPELADGA